MPTSPTMREEFEKAYHSEYDQYDPCSHLAIALWAARWMAERCAIESDKWTYTPHSAKEASYKISESIRQLAKDL